MQDIDALKAEMQKHQEMMNDMHNDVMSQQTMCQNAMSMMQSEGTKGETEPGSEESGTMNPHGHNH